MAVDSHLTFGKTILDCSPENEGFYIKCKYEKAGSEMHHYYSQEALDHGV
jgi:glucosamine-phosphate N-acetyltransferase